MNDWEKGEATAIGKNQAMAKELLKAFNVPTYNIGKVSSDGFVIRFDTQPEFSTGKGFWVKTNSGYAQHKGKVLVFLLWPHVNHRHYEPAERDVITVSLERGMPTIAKEITRRLLADYDNKFQAQLDRAAVDTADAARKRATMMELHDMCCGGTLSDHHLSESKLYAYDLNISEFYVSEDGKTALIKTHYLPVAVIKELVAVLKKHKNTKA